jgi:hypothetical protein
MDYDIFRDELGKKHAGYGHALWVPGPGPGPAVEVGDVGVIQRGKFYRLFNVLLPHNDPSQIFGVPGHYEQLEPNIHPLTLPGSLGPNDLRSWGVTVESGGLGIRSSG